MENAFFVTLGIGLGILLMFVVLVVLLWVCVVITNIKQQGWRNWLG